jgi:hypothetical protein
MSPRTSFLSLAAATLLLAGCGEEKVTTYRVPKEQDAAMPGQSAPEAANPDAATPSGPAPSGPAPSMADTAVPTAEGDGLAWQAPGGWVPKKASAMRKGSFTVAGPGGDADLSITAFPGDVGGELANVNRWRSQIGMTPLAASELDGAVSHLQVNNLDLVVVELFPTGDPKSKSILGAMVPYAGSTWFFKLAGPGTSVQAAREAFLGFLHTVHAP